MGLIELIEFFHITKEEYNSLCLQNSLTEDAIYFLKDTQEVYKGNMSFTNSIIFYEGIADPDIKIFGKLYFNTETGQGKVYDGIDFIEVFSPDKTFSDDFVISSEGVVSLAAPPYNKYDVLGLSPNEEGDYYLGPVVTIMEDDGRASFRDSSILQKDSPNTYKAMGESFEQIFDSLNVKPTLAIVTDWCDHITGYNTDGSSFKCMDVRDLYDLYSKGYDIQCHSKTHSQSVWKTDGTVNSTAIDEELKYCYKWFANKLFPCVDALVYPFSSDNDTDIDKIKAVARKYFRYGFTTSPNDNIIEEIDNWLLPRISLYDNTIDRVKSAVDTCIDNSNWLIICTHARYDNFGKLSSETLRTLLEYCINKKVRILPFNQAVRLKYPYFYGDFNSANRLMVYPNGLMQCKLTDKSIISIINRAKQMGLIDAATGTGYVSIDNKIENAYMSDYYQLEYTAEADVAGTISFLSSNTAVATVTNKGFINFTGTGNVTIRLMSSNGYFDSCNIKVKSNPNAYDFGRKVCYFPFAGVSTNTTILIEIESSVRGSNAAKNDSGYIFSDKHTDMADGTASFAISCKPYSSNNMMLFFTPDMNVPELTNNYVRYSRTIRYDETIPMSLLINKDNFTINQTTYPYNRNLGYAQPRTGYAYINTADGPVEPNPETYKTNKELAEAVADGRMYYNFTTLKVSYLKIWNNTKFSSLEDAKKSTIKPDFWLKVDDSGKPYNAGTGGNLIFSDSEELAAI